MADYQPTERILTISLARPQPLCIPHSEQRRDCADLFSVLVARRGGHVLPLRVLLDSVYPPETARRNTEA